jgi:hypothetical protein
MPEGPMSVSTVVVRVLAAVFLAASMACAAKPRTRALDIGEVESGAGSLVAARKYLEGRWVLESFEIYPPGKTAMPLTGAGTLLYDEFGNLRMDIRADQASTALLLKAGLDLGDGVLSTDGRTAIDLQNRTLTYVLEGQPRNLPGPLAMNRPRHWDVKGDILTLTTRDDNGKPLSVGRWKKAQ